MAKHSNDKLKITVIIDKKKTIRNIVLVVAIAVVLFMIYYLHVIEPTLKWSELIKVMTGALVLIGIIYSIMTYELAQKKNSQDMRMQKMSTTYKACSEWYSKDMINHSRNISNMEQSSVFGLIRTDIVAFTAHMDSTEGEEFKKSLICVFNYFETLSIASNEELMDEAFVKKYFSGIYLRYYTDYLPLIEHRRVVKHNPDVWVGFTSLVEKWKTIR